MYKVRDFPDKNYKAIWANGCTLRLRYDNSKPIEELDYAEFYDISITDRCSARCPYCYQDSAPEREDHKDIINKFKAFFEPMSLNQRPFQVAIGGGEPTIHKDFLKLLEVSASLGIVPNYTTNGLWSTVESEDWIQALLTATKKYSMGVAVSTHPHLEASWKEATRLLSSYGIKTNLHVIISDEASVDKFISIYEEFKNIVEYFVLLPLTASGRAKESILAWDYLVDRMPPKTTKIAFGANFYPYLKDAPNHFDVSLYSPEIMSSYIKFDSEEVIQYKSSFNLTPKYVERG